MGFRNGAFATVWEVKPGQGKYTDVRLSISRKNKETEEYEQDFGGYVRFVGAEASDFANGLNERDRIKLNSVDVTNRYDKEKNVTYTNFTVFDAEYADGGGSVFASEGESDDEFVQVKEPSADDIPFFVMN